ncbi:bifunctional 2-polyprenyl-6-hydroxyphenol methylase/3-demethylubiquinol 3-O-methyltransferase UbiG [Chelatococcus asaccharovorans]|uniref:Ubiquinone biosynthesis O-methyltransferase n=1 Tax=Chelatococcus asaccharovorans TaxID=28210 RepID=A0A2V3U9T9_9HYPH|nr:bifunctional 2-polyprenyl-6-hydroxyphenol methylase/3-demethylubiquinol 3-O-methyltransferase UbiG [Chelatococcus asaccharovorans]MBS7705354.1 bifunctional 2-polyprenyl-6-hydroxyphenol methylase/3-demethylubiquinol 3-O-methyltransferase UbiG [Chelatococcus asaccharovorans]PXW60243.1 3-demethylubiquinone-9 3-methyltransferase [Chelatococcus asaccharovorans]CAH1654983.1 Ubiquinone biosynthesis O-methyltransferase [Chelatococcus asaccharovorans]CAH1685573.1 Ubiquinone biosynthesis O-methyltrans
MIAPRDEAPKDAAAQAGQTVDPAEVARFDKLADSWWDPNGPMRPLHQINPLRLAYIRDAVAAHFGRSIRAPKPLSGLALLDIGAGGGLLAEPLARLGADVTGLEPAAGMAAAARRHAEESGLSIDYRTETIEAVAARGERFDVVTAMEVVEHVADVAVFVKAACAVAGQDGIVILSTLNRTLRSFALAIVGAEYLLRWLPRGTHDWEKFVTPDELTEAVAAAGFTVNDRKGVVYNPLSASWRLSGDLGVNYMLTATR